MPIGVGLRTGGVNMLPSEARMKLAKAAAIKNELERRLAVDAAIEWARDRFPKCFTSEGAHEKTPESEVQRRGD